MSKSFLLFSFLMVLGHGKACDVCGCAMGAFSQGIMPDYSAHYVGFRYNWSQFHAQIDHDFPIKPMESSTDTYQRFDVVARYNVSKKVKLNLTIPYVYNVMEGSHQSLNASGFGDPVFLIQYQFGTGSLIQKNHFVTFGSGIKFPIGKSDQLDNGELVNRNFQIGTGSFDVLITGNYFYRKNKSAVSVESSYKINTENQDKYRFGNQFNFSASYVFITGKKKVNFLGFAGMYVEQAGSHKDDLQRVFNTGGIGVYSNTGLQCYFSKVRFSFGFQYPLYQKFQTDNLTTISAKPRLAADLIFFFGK